MHDDQLIAISAFCTSHHIEPSFIDLLKENDLLEIIMVEDQMFIPPDQLPFLEKIIRLHYDLDINLEGIEAITHLLQRVEHMQHEITMLTHRLGLYEAHPGLADQE